MLGLRAVGCLLLSSGGLTLPSAATSLLSGQLLRTLLKVCIPLLSSSCNGLPLWLMHFAEV